MPGVLPRIELSKPDTTSAVVARLLRRLLRRWPDTQRVGGNVCLAQKANDAAADVGEGDDFLVRCHLFLLDAMCDFTGAQALAFARLIRTYRL